MASLRAFLKQSPTPARLKVELEDGEKTVKVGDSRSRIRDAEMACKGALRIEALDSDGDTLRVWEADDAPAARVADAVAPVAATPQALDAMAMVATIAKLLQEAADAAAQRHAEAYQLAYQQQGVLVTAVVDRLAQLETAYQTTILARAAEVEAAAEEVEAAAEEVEAQQAAVKPSESPNEQLVTALLQGAVMKMAANGGEKS